MPRLSYLNALMPRLALDSMLLPQPQFDNTFSALGPRIGHWNLYVAKNIYFMCLSMTLCVFW